ncbi:MAG TPA: hypothetical protein PK691_00820, partial [Thermomicrobiales bacterium]|nr:hypothetical protein [Thermomicrobiales bacterium]
PATVTKSVLYVPSVTPDEHPWESIESFRDFVGRYLEAGISDIILQPPPEDETGIVEQIANDCLPEFR